jgi:hypothetical protein
MSKALALVPSSLVSFEALRVLVVIGCAAALGLAGLHLPI